jgi:HPt (histidine-containing phosphotransfer) domain-containing protein
MEDSKDLMLSEVMERLDGDREFLLELATEFLASFEVSWERLKGAVQRGEYGEVDFQAHTLKSALGNLGAVGAAEICGELERIGRFKGDLELGGRLVEELREGVERFGVRIRLLGGGE